MNRKRRRIRRVRLWSRRSLAWQRDGGVLEARNARGEYKVSIIDMVVSTWDGAGFRDHQTVFQAIRACEQEDARRAKRRMIWVTT
ncbi:MAG: hypothetical protein EKK55_16240 [Rhodocyclaceae bacterium]|nr:MAG: hypothetical protein EKK55_16240 [Rhodocyclaceae bacterium]